MVGSLGNGLDELPARAEDLHLVVLGGTKHKPRIVLIPVEARNTVCEAAMHEETMHY